MLRRVVFSPGLHQVSSVSIGGRGGASLGAYFAGSWGRRSASSSWDKILGYRRIFASATRTRTRISTTTTTTRSGGKAVGMDAMGEMQEEGRGRAGEMVEEIGIPASAQELAGTTLPEEKKEKEMKKEEEKKKKLPPLSAQEFKAYNHMAEHMDMFHSHFRQTWTTLSTACDRNTRPANLSIRQFLSLISTFCHQLTLHHTIEEQHIFPVLAKKMEFFSPEAHALTQHAGIHRGVEELEEWVQEIKEGGKEFSLRELKGILDGFGEVLWKHLDDEVETLGAENMRRFWSLEEMRRMPM